MTLPGSIDAARFRFTSAKIIRFLFGVRCIACLMDAFLNFMTADTAIFGVNVHNWMLALAGFILLWATVIAQDL